MGQVIMEIVTQVPIDCQGCDDEVTVLIAQALDDLDSEQLTVEQAMWLLAQITWWVARSHHG